MAVTWVRQIFSKVPLNFSAPNPCDKDPCDRDGRVWRRNSSTRRDGEGEGGEMSREKRERKTRDPKIQRRERGELEIWGGPDWESGPEAKPGGESCPCALLQLQLANNYTFDNIKISSNFTSSF